MDVTKSTTKKTFQLRTDESVHLFLMVDATRAKIIRIWWLMVGPGSMKNCAFVQLNQLQPSR